MVFVLTTWSTKKNAYNNDLLNVLKENFDQSNVFMPLTYSFFIVNPTLNTLPQSMIKIKVTIISMISCKIVWHSRKDPKILNFRVNTIQII